MCTHTELLSLEIFAVRMPQLLSKMTYLTLCRHHDIRCHGASSLSTYMWILKYFRGLQSTGEVLASGAKFTGYLLVLCICTCHCTDKCRVCCTPSYWCALLLSILCFAHHLGSQIISVQNTSKSSGVVTIPFNNNKHEIAVH